MNQSLTTSLRSALSSLSAPKPLPTDVYLPRPHLRALNSDTLVVSGMSGAGKTFWTRALLDAGVRERVGVSGSEVRIGFGEESSKDILRQLMDRGQEARVIWRAVMAWQLAEDGHPIRRENSWHDRVEYIAQRPEEAYRLFQRHDEELEQRGVHSLILFDSLERCADNPEDVNRMVRGLLQVALEMRPYRRLRVKVFLRSDQVDALQAADFPEIAKALNGRAELSWPRRDLYGLLWQSMVNGPEGDRVREFLGEDKCSSVEAGGQTLYTISRSFITDEDRQGGKFHALVGPWMGHNFRRGIPYSWIPSRLGDAEGRVTPRSFLAALRQAAEDTSERFPIHGFSLHYSSIKRGVREASGVRVAELREAYPWLEGVFESLQGMTFPCGAEEIEGRLSDGSVFLAKLETLGIFQRLPDGRVNIPEVFRVGYGLGRKGGVKPLPHES